MPNCYSLQKKWLVITCKLQVFFSKFYLCNVQWHFNFALGKVSLGWIETRPRLIIADPELIKLILAEKNGQITKPPLNPLVNLLQMGISTLEGEQWAKRRRLIKPAFHLEKLKVKILHHWLATYIQRVLPLSLQIIVVRDLCYLID